MDSGKMTDNKFKVTVIIPCFNDGLYLKDSVQSIFDQTFDNCNIIIVDDASTDHLTESILESLVKDSALQVVHLESNQGTACSRNKGISLTDSPYILTLDANDKFAATFLEKAVAVLDKNPNIGVVTCGVQEFGLQNLYWLPKGGKIGDFLVENNCCGNALFRRKFWEDAGGYDGNIAYEDWDFWISGTSKGWEVHVINEPLFYYRKLRKSKTTRDAPQKAYIYKQIVKKHKDIYCMHIEEVLFQKEVQLQTQYYLPIYQKYLKLICWLSNTRTLLRNILIKLGLMKG